MEPEEPGTIFDLREFRNPEKKTKYNVFWNEAETYIYEGVEQLLMIEGILALLISQ